MQEKEISKILVGEEMKFDRPNSIKYFEEELRSGGGGGKYLVSMSFPKNL
jgi:hypothetical protein